MCYVDSSVCSIYGKVTNLLNPCGCNSGHTYKGLSDLVEDYQRHQSPPPTFITTGSTEWPEENTDLEDLFNELGTSKWLGIGHGWDDAIEAVRKHIAGKLQV